MSKHHEIELDDLLNWASDSEIMYASSTRERKSLYCDLSGYFKLKIDGDVIWKGRNAAQAVRKYNSITEKFNY